VLALQQLFFFAQIFHQAAFLQFEQFSLSIEVFISPILHGVEIFDDCTSSAILISLFTSIFALFSLQETFPFPALFLQHGFP